MGAPEPLTPKWQIAIIPLSIGVMVAGAVALISRHDWPDAPAPLSYVEKTTDECQTHLNRWKGIQTELKFINTSRNLYYSMGSTDPDAGVPLSQVALPTKPIQWNDEMYGRYRQAVVFEDNFDAMVAEADRRVAFFAGLKQALNDPAEYEHVQRELDAFVAKNPDPAWVEELQAVQDQSFQEWRAEREKKY